MGSKVCVGVLLVWVRAEGESYVGVRERNESELRDLGRRERREVMGV